MEGKINALEVKTATLEANLINLHQDINELTQEVRALRTEIFKGKGIAIGILLVAGAAYTVITQFFIQ
jgi:uncharacterized membrane protein YukC